MSILEKAYLKAMSLEAKGTQKSKQESNISGLVDDCSDLNRMGIETSRPQTKEAQDIVTSRVGISQMNEVERYSAKTFIEKRLINSKMEDKQLLDRYRNIRTKLLSNSKKENFVTLVTSVVPNTNSALVAGNIAVTFALDEAKTSMLVEANINSPSLNELFDMSGKDGLIEYLESDELDASQILLKTGIPRLRVVPSGLHRENSAEYFTSTKMAQFIKEIVNRYPDRYPIINAPCVLNSADTRILIELCDKVVLVVPYGKCSDEQIMQAAITIGEEKLAGAVLDGF